MLWAGSVFIMKLYVWNWRAGEEPLTRGRNEDTTCLCDYWWDFGTQAELLSVGRVWP